MSISDANATTLNNAMVANQRVGLGTIVQGLQDGAVTAGSVVLTAVEANASALSIYLGTTPTVAMVQVYRSGSALGGTWGAYGINVDKTAGSLVLSNSGSYTIVANDWVNYIVS